MEVKQKCHHDRKIMIESGIRYQLTVFFKFFTVIVLVGLVSPITNAQNQPRNALIEMEPAMGWVDESACASCHTAEHQQWQSSHHAQALAPATKFHSQVSNQLTADEQPTYVIGYEPLQQVLIETGKGLLQAHYRAWDTKQQEWFDLYPEVAKNTQHPLHWRQPAHLANTQCISCHVTNYKAAYDIEKASFSSSWQALGVGCQSCHGPAEQHLQWAKSNPNNSRPYTTDIADRGFVLNMNTSEQQLQVCAQCHSRRNELRPFTPKKSVHDQFLVSPLSADLYEVDGKIKDEVFEYGSFLQSKMYQAGVVCSDCHNAHSGALKSTSADNSGNAVCTQCHTDQGTANIAASRLPEINLAKLKSQAYDSSAHHFHPNDSAGAQCVSCHMPGKLYMGNDLRHDHSFSSPNPEQALELNHSDACLGCHEQQPTADIVAAFQRWYPNASARDSGYAKTLHAARKGQAGAASALLTLLNKDEMPLIRQSALLSELVNYPSNAAQQKVAQKLTHSDALLRRTALLVAPSLFDENWLQRHIPALLQDPMLAVRVTAVEQLMALNYPLSAKQLAEYSALQQHHLGRAEGHFNLSIIATVTGQNDAVEPYLRAALQRDSLYVPAIVALAQWLEARNPQQALTQLQQAIEQNPQAADLNFALALALIRQGDLSGGVKYLRESAQQAPGNSHYTYVLAIALHDTGERAEALYILRNALALAPQQRDIRLALLQYTERPKEREQLLQEWQQLNPNDPLLTNLKVN